MIMLNMSWMAGDNTNHREKQAWAIPGGRWSDYGWYKIFFCKSTADSVFNQKLKSKGESAGPDGRNCPYITRTKRLHNAYLTLQKQLK